MSGPDAYTVKARWLPAALVTVPIVVLMISTFELDAFIGIVGPAGVSLLFGVVAGEIARSRGKGVELSLVRDWGGLPTTRSLRATPVSDPERRRRREQVEAVSGRRLPSLLEQESAPSESDTIIEQIVRTALAVLRSEESSGVDVLQNENISYGFRRNLYALRPFGLVVAVAAFGFTFAVTVLGILAWAVATPILLIQATVGVLWLAIARRDWVKEQAESFEDRFFIALDAAAARRTTRAGQ
ncbi:hypothetical protein QL996_03655 [Planococcus sp. APC 4015]|nr:hypothetical protein [Planococcus sp. APC 4015]